MWTWEHPDGVHKVEIDHILFRGKWRKSVRNCRTYSTVELGSDHRIATAELRISLRVPLTDQKIVRRDMQVLNNSADLQNDIELKLVTDLLHYQISSMKNPHRQSMMK